MMKVSKIAFIEAGQTNKVTFDRHVDLLRKLMKLDPHLLKHKNQPKKLKDLDFSITDIA